MSEREDLALVAATLQLGKGGPKIADDGSGGVDLQDALGATLISLGRGKAVHTAAYDGAPLTESSGSDTTILTLDTSTLTAPYLLVWSMETQAGNDAVLGTAYPLLRALSGSATVWWPYGGMFYTVYNPSAGLWIETANQADAKLRFRSSKAGVIVRARRARMFAMELHT